MWEGDFVPDVSDEENFGESEGTASILYRRKPCGVQSERKLAFRKGSSVNNTQAEYK